MYPHRHRNGPASHGVAPPFRVHVRSSLAAVLVLRSPHALGARALDSRVFATPDAANDRKNVNGSLSWACALLQSAPNSKPPLAITRSHVLVPVAPPMRFAPLQRLPARGSGFIDAACLTASPAPSGFPNLSTLCSAPCLPALFRAGSAPGVAPSRALLLPRDRTPSPAPVPSCRWKQPSNLLCRWITPSSKSQRRNEGTRRSTPNAELPCRAAETA
jgi:hypothetical protein